MPNQYQEEIQDDTLQRDLLFYASLATIYEAIREKVDNLATNVYKQADGDKNYLKKRNRQKRLAKKTNEELRPEYLKRDNFLKARYVEEYGTQYAQSSYATINEGISQGHKARLKKFTNSQFNEAWGNPLSKLVDDAKMKTGRSVDIEQIYTSISNGITQGKSLPKISKDLDRILGFRNAKGKWIGDNLNGELAGQRYRTMRILRTEINRIRSSAATDQWLNEQDIVPSKLQWKATFDNRTRRQSVQMNNQIANKKGEFRYPNGAIARQSESGIAEYEIFDRCFTIPLDPNYSETPQISKDKNGKYQIKPYKNFKEYADDIGMTHNKYGQSLFGDPKKKVIAKKTISKPTKKIRKEEIKSSIDRNVKAVSKPVKTTIPKRAINKSEINKLTDKKSVYSMKLTKDISKEFNVPVERVLQVEADFTKKYPRRKLTIDQLRGLVVDDMKKEIEFLQRQLRKG